MKSIQEINRMQRQGTLTFRVMGEILTALVMHDKRVMEENDYKNLRESCNALDYMGRNYEKVSRYEAAQLAELQKTFGGGL